MYRLATINRATMQNLIMSLQRKSANADSLINLQSRLIVGGGESGRAVYSQLLQFQMPLLQKAEAVERSNTCQVSCNMMSSSQRQQSTTLTNAEKVEKKNSKRSRRPRFAKYIELLEVTNVSASERQSRVKRLKAKKLQAFIAKAQAQILEKRSKAEKRNKPKTEQPVEYQKIDMDTFDPCSYDDKPLIFFGKDSQRTTRIFNDPAETQQIIKSFNRFREIIETMEHEVNDQAALDGYSLPSAHHGNHAEEGLVDSFEPYITPEKSARATTAQVTTKAKPRYKSKIHNNEEQERLAKERSIRINLTSYLNVCVSSNLLNRGFSTLLAYRQRAKKNVVHHRNLVNIELYNILLHGYAGVGTYERFNDIFNILHEDGIAFNEQTFAAVFECLGRLESTEKNIKEIEKFINKSAEMGFTLHHIMDSSKFIADQRDIALDAIRRVQPSFTPTYTPPALGYVNPLLKSLNTHIKPVDSETSSKNLQDNVIKNSKHRFTKLQLEQMARDQLKIELDGCITIKSIEKNKEFANAEQCREKLQELEVLWRSQICSAITRDLNTLKAQVRFKPNGYMTYYTYLRTLDAAQFSEILLKEIYKLAEGSETFSPTVGQLFKELGQKVQKRYLIEQKKRNGTLEKIGEVYSSYCEIWNDDQSTDNTRQMWQRLVHAQRCSGSSMDIREIAWPSNVLMGVGRFLYNILMRDIKIDSHIMRQKVKSKQQNFLPAFYTLFRNQGRLVKEEVKPHPVLARLFRASRQQTLTFDSNFVPMLSPPQPWSTTHNGGYLLNKTELIRLPHQAIQQWERINSASPQSIFPALDSLNQLASVPWRVNTDVLDVIVEVFQNGGDHKLDVPKPPSSLPPLPSLPDKDATVSNAERARLFKEKLTHRRKQAEMYSLWCDTLYRLSLAQHYREKVFWLPHNMDFRGRVYPVPPHLNHLGSDLARSMLVFDQPQPLGIDGFSWLKLHCINLTGLKKRHSVRERLRYAEKVMPEILDSADRPLTGRMWWARSDEPWQTLACCMEIAKVNRAESPEKYLSRFPIHQDGSCNGLQHYAALGRDKAGAISVNLAPANTPQDVYNAVAALVETSRQTDAANGLLVAQALEGFVRRKVIKQTVMTTVYGVTRYGARLQIARQLKDIDAFPKDWVWPASTYLTTKTFESLREMFTSTREIQDWLTECARLIAGVCSQNVEWCTPLGLPVVQPYTRQDYRHTQNSSTRVSETMSMDLYERPNVLKQKNAFPPNFIHSLDSSHMMLTSLHCERQGITFISVHDCFWTHACTVPEMNRICREQFVALHSQPILEELSDFLASKYSFKTADLTNDGSSEDLSKRNLNRVLRQLPEKGDFDLRNVLDSIYFFS